MGNKKQKNQLAKPAEMSQNTLPHAALVAITYNLDTNTVLDVRPLFPFSMNIDVLRHIIGAADDALVQAAVIKRLQKETQDKTAAQKDEGIGGG